MDDDQCELFILKPQTSEAKKQSSIKRKSEFIRKLRYDSIGILLSR